MRRRKYLRALTQDGLVEVMGHGEPVTALALSHIFDATASEVKKALDRAVEAGLMKSGRSHMELRDARLRYWLAARTVDGIATPRWQPGRPADELTGYDLMAFQRLCEETRKC